jgi:hypothetical protein
MDKSKFITLVTGFLPAMVLALCSCVSVKTSMERSEYKKSGNSWVIRSEGNMVTFEESVLNDAKKQAAEKSNSEGMDCFVVTGDVTSPREATTTRTMYGKSSDGTSFSYETPSESHYSIPMVSLFVSFHNYDECKNFEKTKGQEKVFYNNETIKNAKYIEIKNLMKEIFVWGSSIGIIVLLILI